MKTALPALWAMLLYKVPWLVSLHFVGNIGKEELASAALASTLCNVTGLSLSVGLSSALTTMTAQARGDLLSRMVTATTVDDSNNNNGYRHPGDHNDTVSPFANLSEPLDAEKDAENASEVQNSETTPLMHNRSQLSRSGRNYQNEEQCKQPITPLVYLYRGLWVQLLVVLPIGIWWLTGIESMLLALGQGEHLSEMTATYLKVLTPGLWSYSINWTLTAWLQSIEMADVPAYAAATGLILHIPSNAFFIYTLNWGYLGVGVATVLFQLVQPILMCLYLFVSLSGRKRLMQQMGAQAMRRTRLSFWPEFQLAISWDGICQYMGLALPGIVIISEWWASEVAIFLSGRLVPSPNTAIGAMTIYQSINTFCFMFPVAVGTAGATRVGNLLGLGKSQDAQCASRVSISLAAVVAAATGSVLYFTPHAVFPRFFTPDDDVVTETSHLLPLLALYVIADGIQSSFNGIIKGCGRQVVSMPIVVVSYWVVAIPLAYYLSFVENDGVMYDDRQLSGVVGLVIGMTTGTWCHMILLGLFVIGTINWDEDVKRARARVRASPSS